MEPSNRSECFVPGISMALIEIICYTIPQDNCACLQIVTMSVSSSVFHPLLRACAGYLSSYLSSHVSKSLCCNFVFRFRRLFMVLSHICYSSYYQKDPWSVIHVSFFSLVRQKQPAFCLICARGH
jgi:hypothetical protein